MVEAFKSLKVINNLPFPNYIKKNYHHYTSKNNCITCECGSVINQAKLSKHEITKKTYFLFKNRFYVLGDFLKVITLLFILF